jgi:integrase
MPPVSLPYLQVVRARGKSYPYYRRDGRQVRIKAPIGSVGFAAAYEAAREAWEGKKPDPKPVSHAERGTMRHLIDSYKAAPEYRQMAPKTKADYNRVIAMLTDRFGPAPVDRATRDWVLRLRNERQDTPRTANYIVAIIGALFTFGIDAGLARDNPALRIKKLKTGDGYRCWTDAEVTAMTSKEVGDVALPVLLGRYTGQREADILSLPWGAYDGQTITLRQHKTGTFLVLPVAPELRTALDAEPRRGLLICLTKDGKVFKPDWFRHRFAQVRALAQLPADLHFHGLRHTRLTELAEGGASEAEIMANSGHKTASMVTRYTKHARQKGLAAAGVARLPKRKANTDCKTG